MFLKDIRLIFHEKRNLILLLVLAVAVAVGIYCGTGLLDGMRVRMGVADEDDSEYSRILLSYFDSNEVFNSYMEVVAADQEQLERMFRDGRLDLYVVIPEGFTENLININNMPIRAVIDSSNITRAIVYKNLLQAYGEYISDVEAACQTLYDVMREEGYDIQAVRDVNTDISIELIFTALGKDNFFRRNEISRIKGISLIDYYVYSVLVLLILYCGLFTGLSFLRERLSNTSVRLRSVGASVFGQMMSKVTAFTLLYGIFMTGAAVAINEFSGMRFGIGAICFIWGALFVSSMFFVLMAMCFRSVGSFYFFANTLILLMTVCGGGIIPIMYLPESMAQVARLTPNYWFIRVLL